MDIIYNIEVLYIWCQSFLYIIIILKQNDVVAMDTRHLFYCFGLCVPSISSANICLSII